MKGDKVGLVQGEVSNLDRVDRVGRCGVGIRGVVVYREQEQEQETKSVGEGIGKGGGR